jgi:hypothetical protein
LPQLFSDRVDCVVLEYSALNEGGIPTMYASIAATAIPVIIQFLSNITAVFNMKALQCLSRFNRNL